MASTITAAYAKLQVLVPTWITGLQVVVGQFGTYVANEQVVFGDINAAESLGPFAGAAPETFDESYDINVQLRTFAGGDDVNGRLTRVLAMKDAVRDGLAADMSMSGTVTRAYLQRHTSRSGVDESGNGVAAECDLVIHCDAYGV